MRDSLLKDLLASDLIAVIRTTSIMDDQHIWLDRTSNFSYHYTNLEISLRKAKTNYCVSLVINVPCKVINLACTYKRYVKLQDVRKVLLRFLTTGPIIEDKLIYLGSLLDILEEKALPLRDNEEFQVAIEQKEVELGVSDYRTMTLEQALAWLEWLSAYVNTGKEANNA